MRRLLLPFGPFVLLLAACPAPPPLHWTYQSQWEGLCSSGKKQSPIDLHVAAATNFAPRIQLEYWPSHIHSINNGHTIQFNYDSGSFLTFDGKRYALEQFHIHHPGEHTLDGKSWPMELHFVHKAENGKLAVVGIAVVEGAANAWMQQAANDLPVNGDRRDLTAKVNAADLLPSSRAYFHYSGSLTVPPCSEGVDWFVLKTPIEMSAAQLAAFAKAVEENHRPIQPLNGRVIEQGDAK